MSSTVGIGIDLVDVDRFAKVLRRRPRLTERLFTAGERHDCNGAPQRMAARFAAKEAVWKALSVGLGGVNFHDVAVERAASGAPELVLSARALTRAAELGITNWHLSLTHTPVSAGAIVIAEGE